MNTVPQHRLDLAASVLLDLAAALRQLACTLETLVATADVSPENRSAEKEAKGGAV
jgi:hypothetical protein